MIKKTIQVSAPPGTVGNWSFMTFTSNLMAREDFMPASRMKSNLNQRLSAPPSSVVNKVIGVDVNYSDSTMGGQILGVGTLNTWAWSDDRGSQSKPFFPAGNSNGLAWVPPTQTYTLDCNPNAGGPEAASKVRVIAMGFELHNTTAEIYKQGTITISRAPADTRDSTIPGFVASVGTPPAQRIVGYTNPTVNNVLNSQFEYRWGRKMVAPPLTLSDALAYVGTIQHEAAEGAYVNCAMDTSKCALQYGYVAPREIGSCQQYVDAENTSGISTGLISSPSWFDATSRHAYAQPVAYNNEHPFHQSTVMVTGLSKESTFTLEFKVMVEVSPHLADPVYGPLAWSCSPSAPHDPHALAIYQAAIPRMPVGVKVADNASGGFWNFIKNTISDLAPLVGGIIAGPAGSIIGTLGTGIAKMIKGRSKAAAAAVSAHSTLPAPKAKSKTKATTRPATYAKPKPKSKAITQGLAKRFKR